MLKRLRRTGRRDARVARALRQVPFFAALGEEQLAAFGAAFSEQNSRAGAQLFSRGDTASNFYVLAAGEVSVTVPHDQLVASDGPDGGLGDGGCVDCGSGEAAPASAAAAGSTTAEIVLKTLTAPDHFGEQSLLSEAGSGAVVRTASVSAHTAVGLLVLSAASFAKLLEHHEPAVAAAARAVRDAMAHVASLRTAERLRSTLRAVKVLASLPEDKVELLGAAMTLRAVPAGDVIFAEGQAADGLYVVARGRVQARSAGRFLADLAAGSCFGEIALLSDVPRTATVRALAPCDLLFLDKGAFLAVLGTLPASVSDELRGVVEQRTANDLRNLCLPFFSGLDDGDYRSLARHARLRTVRCGEPVPGIRGPEKGNRGAEEEEEEEEGKAGTRVEDDDDEGSCFVVVHGTVVVEQLPAVPFAEGQDGGEDEDERAGVGSMYGGECADAAAAKSTGRATFDARQRDLSHAQPVGARRQPVTSQLSAGGYFGEQSLVAATLALLQQTDDHAGLCASDDVLVGRVIMA